tara:strand:+ start:86 stop:565 length:480 start_codon:yes stop_codon:yes gene_type:complete
MTLLFKSDEYNFDSKQSLKMEEKKNKLINSHNYKNININNNNINNNNNNNFNSINEAKDYLGCIGNNCAKIENNEVNNLKNPINSNKENDESNKNNKLYTNIFSDLIKNYSKNFIYFLYVLFVSILLTYSILEKNNMNLVIILILTLIFIFYNIFFVRS